MDKFTKLTGVAAPLPQINVDTDMIIPKQFLKTIKRSGLGKNLFDEMRYDDDGNEDPGFRAEPARLSRGRRSSGGRRKTSAADRRGEHAPWALLDFGIRCVVAPSFADILLQQLLQERYPAHRPAAGGRGQADGRRQPRFECRDNGRSREARRSPAPTADRSRSMSTPSASTACFNGLDDIGLTLEKAAAIDAFENRGRAGPPLGLTHCPCWGSSLMQMQHSVAVNRDRLR